MCPQGLMHAELALQRARLNLLGYYHSHAGASALPSDADRHGVFWGESATRLNIVFAVQSGDLIVFSAKGLYWRQVSAIIC